MSELNITSDINTAFNKFLLKAVEKDSPELLNSCLSFIRRICRDSIRHRNIKHFNDYIFFPTKMYVLLYPKQRSGMNLDSGALSGHIEILSLHLKEIIWLDFNIFGKYAKDLKDKLIINQFYRLAFSSFSNYLYTIISFKDWQTFQKALAHYGELSEGVFDNNYQANYELNRLKQAIYDPNDETIKQLQLQVDENNKYQEYRRQVLSGIKYWLIFLYSERVLDSQVLKELLIKTSEVNSSIEDESKDILTMRSEGTSSFDWGRWDHIERESGKVYFPPMVHDWMTLGYFISRLRERKLSFVVDKISPRELRDVPYLYDKLMIIKQNILTTAERWIEVVNVESERELEEIMDKFIGSVGQAKRVNVGFREHAIAAAPLDTSLIADFREKIGHSWRKELRIRPLFKYFGNYSDVSNDDIKLKFVGQRTFLAKAKIAFITGEYYNNIYGLEQFGGQVGRGEDDLFFHIANNSEPDSIAARSMTQLLTDGLAKLRSTGATPNVIFIEPEYGYKDDELLKSPSFSNRPTIDIVGETGPGMLGAFDGVTIFWSFSRSLKNRALIAEFDSAFKMEIKSDARKFDDELEILVEPLTEELAEERLRNEPGKWRTTDEGIELSDTEALTLIRTSVIVEVGTIIDFKILDKAKFLFGYVANPVSD